MKRTPFLLPLLAAFLLALLATPQALYAQSVSFQGRLTTPDGQPVPDGTYGITYSFYNRETGGTPLWTETDLTASTQGGVLFAQISQSFFSTSLDSETLDLFFELTIEGETLAPRIPVSSVPFALAAYSLGPDALQAGPNVTLERQDDGSLMISATGGSTGGLASVATDATLDGTGISTDPLSLADGSVTACDQDLGGDHVIGTLDAHTLGELWRQGRFQELRHAHHAGRFDVTTLCAACAEWHRP